MVLLGLSTELATVFNLLSVFARRIAIGSVAIVVRRDRDTQARRVASIPFVVVSIDFIC